jgi:2-polyprenyl-3-methyl-5-hydroxy-6-metoxy-1,4-benzoquinol methylase
MASIAEISRVLSDVYAGASWPQRLLTVGRPWICPLHVLVEHVPRGASLLDVGCGAGAFVNLLAHQQLIARGVGVDSSARAIAAAQAAARALTNGVGVEFQLRPVEHGLPDAMFDVVSMIDVMHHITPGAQRSALEAAAARVKGGGLLLFKDVGPRPRWRAWASRLHDAVIARQWIHIVPADSIVDWMQALHFEVVHKETINVLWYGHELLVFRKTVDR